MEEVNFKLDAIRLHQNSIVTIIIMAVYFLTSLICYLNQEYLGALFSFIFLFYFTITGIFEKKKARDSLRKRYPQFTK